MAARDGGVGRLGSQALAGMVASLVTLAYCLSFAALVFPGSIGSGLPYALWSFLMASAIVTLICGVATTLPPILAAPRNPVVAVMAVLSATVSAAAFARGMSEAAAVQHVLMALSAATLLAGLALFALGHFNLGQIVRFVPYPVIAGFLGASGALLILGGVKVGSGLTALPKGLPEAGTVLRLAIAGAIGVGLILLRQRKAGVEALPWVILALAGFIHALLWATGQGPGWFLEASGRAHSWSPLASLNGLDPRVVAAGSVEIASIIAVTMAAMMLDVTSLEVQRRRQADMDAEFGLIGAANLSNVAVGGLLVGHALAPSKLLDALGGRDRIAGIAGGLFVIVVLASGIDLAALMPRPVLGGLLVFLGWGIVAEALTPPGRRGRIELALTLAIAVAIVWLGYLMGIVLGVVGACLHFALSYSRIGVVRRHVTRAQLAAPVERAPEALAFLAAEGGRIHVLWLSGFVFFGSSNGLYEEVRKLAGVAAAPGAGAARRWVVLDCTGVTGLDGSAALALQNLANWAAANTVTVAFAGASPTLVADLAAAGLVGGDGMASFASRNEALEWCEDSLLAEAGAAVAAEGGEALEAWIARELGSGSARQLLDGYLVRRLLAPGDVVCRFGEAADTIELVESGSVAVVLPAFGHEPIRVRRMRGRTVVGEMGFFRGLPRAASVIAEDAAVVYVMTRAGYEQLKRQEPLLCALFLEFIVRALANRVEVANREITALL